jgi:hypothetical protein
MTYFLLLGHRRVVKSLEQRTSAAGLNSECLFETNGELLLHMTTTSKRNEKSTHRQSRRLGMESQCLCRVEKQSRADWLCISTWNPL